MYRLKKLKSFTRNWSRFPKLTFPGSFIFSRLCWRMSLNLNVLSARQHWYPAPHRHNCYHHAWCLVSVISVRGHKHCCCYCCPEPECLPRVSRLPTGRDESPTAPLPAAAAPARPGPRGCSPRGGRGRNHTAAAGHTATAAGDEASHAWWEQGPRSHNSEHRWSCSTCFYLWNSFELFKGFWKCIFNVTRQSEEWGGVLFNFCWNLGFYTSSGMKLFETRSWTTGTRCNESTELLFSILLLILIQIIISSQWNVFFGQWNLDRILGIFQYSRGFLALICATNVLDLGTKPGVISVGHYKKKFLNIFVFQPLIETEDFFFYNAT